MNIKNKTLVFLTIISILSLNACSYHHKNNFTNTAIEEGNVTFLGLSENGNLNVLNSRTGKRIQPCEPRDANSRYGQTHSSVNPCKTRIEERDGKTVVIKDGKVIPAKFDKNIRVIGYEGSHCETIQGGAQYEGCYPFH